MSVRPNLNPGEKRVLAALADARKCYGEHSFMNFRGIAAYHVDLDRRAIRRACRSLRRKGLARFGAGLWTDDGEMCGSGYAATQAGAERIKAEAPE